MTPRPSVMSDYQRGDHLHPLAKNSDNRLERIENFDYSEVDRLLGVADTDDRVTFADASAALALILGWACGATRSKAHESSIISAGARIHSLLFLIDPTNARYRSLADIANAAGMTRAACSKALVLLRDQLGDVLPIRGMLARESYRKAQHAAVAAGVHSSDRKRHKRKATAHALSDAVIA